MELKKQKILEAKEEYKEAYGLYPDYLLISPKMAEELRFNVQIPNTLFRMQVIIEPACDESNAYLLSNPSKYPIKTHQTLFKRLLKKVFKWNKNQQ